MTRVNISLDSLRADRFSKITRVGKLHKTLAGIDAAIDSGFQRIKINTVVLKHMNHDEVRDLVEFARNRGLDISFIEEMPLGIVNDHSMLNAAPVTISWIGGGFASTYEASDGATYLDRVLEPLFADGFESGDTAAWSSSSP